jgi:hypothetical protein
MLFTKISILVILEISGKISWSFVTNNLRNIVSRQGLTYYNLRAKCLLFQVKFYWNTTSVFVSILWQR